MMYTIAKNRHGAIVRMAIEVYPIDLYDTYRYIQRAHFFTYVVCTRSYIRTPSKVVYTSVRYVNARTNVRVRT